MNEKKMATLILKDIAFVLKKKKDQKTADDANNRTELDAEGKSGAKSDLL
jgi:hypothetical protein